MPNGAINFQTKPRESGKSQSFRCKQCDAKVFIKKKNQCDAERLCVMEIGDFNNLTFKKIKIKIILE